MGAFKRCQESGPQDAKRQRKSLASPGMLAAVVESVEGAARRQGMEENACIVLREMARGGLDTAADERHPFQVEAVNHALKILTQQHQALKLEVVNAEAKITALDDERATLGARTSEAEAAHQKQQESTQQQKISLADATLYAVEAARLQRSLAEATHQVANSKQSISGAEANLPGQNGGVGSNAVLTSAEAALTLHLAPLRDAVDAREAATHVTELKSFAKKMELDESLASAFSKSACKPASERGQFDNMVLQQMEDSILSLIAVAKKDLEASAAAEKQREAAVTQARADNVAAREGVVKAAAAFRSQKTIEQVALDALIQLQLRDADFEKSRASGLKVSDVSKTRLEEFKSFTLWSAETLRDRQSKKEDLPVQTGEQPVASSKAEDVAGCTAD